MFTLLTQPGCGPCIAAKRALQSRKIPHEALNIQENPAALERLRALGYNSTPVTINEATGEHWAGFDPGRLPRPGQETPDAA